MDVLQVAGMCTRVAVFALQILVTINQFLRAVNLIVNSHAKTAKNTPLRLMAYIGDLNGLVNILLHIRLLLFSSIVFCRHTDALVKETVTALNACGGRLKKLGKVLVWLDDCSGLRPKATLPGKLAWAVRGNSAIDSIMGNLTLDRSKLTMMYTMFVG